MKEWIKYALMTLIFFVVYLVLEYLFNQAIDWPLTIISTIMYAILNTIAQTCFNKKKN